MLLDGGVGDGCSCGYSVCGDVGGAGADGGGGDVCVGDGGEG